jgi:lariat debranching enzyme
VHQAGSAESGMGQQPNVPSQAKNPDEIAIDDEDGEESSTQESISTDTPSTSVMLSVGGEGTEVVRNAEEIVLEDEELDVAPPPIPPPQPAVTKFLALDKCLPRRQFLEASQSASCMRNFLMFSML